MILLVNLSTIGSEVRDILGSFILSLLHLCALSRVDTPSDRRRPFHIYCDEAHRFVTSALEDLIAETRKFGVSLTLAHQYLGQFGQRTADALSSTGSTIIFNVDTRDASYLVKDLRELVEVEDLITLGIGEAIARIGTEVVRIRTIEPRAIPQRHFRDRIIRESHRKYYRPAYEVRQVIRRRNDRWQRPFTPLTAASAPDREIEELVYDEF